MTKIRAYLLVGILCGMLTCGLSTLLSATAIELASQADYDNAILEPILPIPLHVELDAQKVALGDKLFHEKQLSHNNHVSCATCHSIALAGIDQLPKSIGTGEGNMNAPTVFNSAFNTIQFWDGRADTLENQINGPIKEASEMNSSWSEIITKLKTSREYMREFKQVYSDNITEEHAKNEIATYMRSLYTPNSRFDQYLRGNQTILTETEKEGYQRFKDYGCVTCHQGVNVGGNMFQKFGVFGDYFEDRGDITKQDLGRYNVTNQEDDRYKFKVPSLRNVVLTGPYFHDGSVDTLNEAVRVMFKYQLGRLPEQDDIDKILQFLNTLTANVVGAQS